jgi:hypothetical protein
MMMAEALASPRHCGGSVDVAGSRQWRSTMPSGPDSSEVVVLGRALLPRTPSSPPWMLAWTRTYATLTAVDGGGVHWEGAGGVDRMAALR